ncbi:bifunctional pinoresinol-lariciresinol reductase 2 [Tanacetum coccineum]|uniref:(+)-lariciresinol reductase n=1 Tax=Tanacetum coccineum TaxID=301880 RepID=A0ABQ5DI31_9ASTR
MSLKSKVLIVGGTGYIGKRLVKASLEHGHATYVLQRREIGVDIEKVQMLLSFKKQGARLVIGSFDDHRSLVEAVKQVDVVICAISGAHIHSHQILLVDAIKEAGNVKRFIPSEFGTDPSRMADAMEPGRVSFDEKMMVRKAIEDAGIPFTYISANCYAGYFVGGLCQFGHILPPMDSVSGLFHRSLRYNDTSRMARMMNGHRTVICYAGYLRGRSYVNSAHILPPMISVVFVLGRWQINYHRYKLAKSLRSLDAKNASTAYR